MITDAKQVPLLEGRSSVQSTTTMVMSASAATGASSQPSRLSARDAGSVPSGSRRIRRRERPHSPIRSTVLPRLVFPDRHHRSARRPPARLKSFVPAPTAFDPTPSNRPSKPLPLQNTTRPPYQRSSPRVGRANDCPDPRKPRSSSSTAGSPIQVPRVAAHGPTWSSVVGTSTGLGVTEMCAKHPEALLRPGERHACA